MKQGVSVKKVLLEEALQDLKGMDDALPPDLRDSWETVLLMISKLKLVYGVALLRVLRALLKVMAEREKSRQG